MPFEVHKCKITVLKRMLHKDLIEEYLDSDALGGRASCICPESLAIRDTPFGYAHLPPAMGQWYNWGKSKSLSGGIG
jgi:hypothetical protein